MPHARVRRNLQAKTRSISTSERLLHCHDEASLNQLHGPPLDTLGQFDINMSHNGSFTTYIDKFLDFSGHLPHSVLKVIISGGQTTFWFKPDHEPIFLLFNPNLLKIMFFESDM